jgi:opacity protein-like surface antigen
VIEVFFLYLLFNSELTTKQKNMKKIIVLVAAFALLSGGISAQFTKLGGGLGFTTGYKFHDQEWSANKSQNFVIHAMGIYELNLPFHIAPSYTFFLPTVEKSVGPMDTFKSTLTTMMFDVNGHYVFNELDKVEFYALAGLDVMLAWRKEVIKMTGSVPSTSKSTESDNALGLNLGAGGYMKLTEQLDLFFEAKYILFSKYDQLMVNAGVLVNIDWLAKNEKGGI